MWKELSLGCNSELAGDRRQEPSEAGDESNAEAGAESDAGEDAEPEAGRAASTEVKVDAAFNPD